MSDSIAYVAAAGMTAAMLRINNDAANISNSGSTGYQAIITETKDTFYNQLAQAGPAGGPNEKPIGIYVGTGVRVTGTSRDLSQGTIKQTNSPLDIAIIGSGYFAVQLPNNVTGYTRAGRFQVNSQRQIVTSEGYLLGTGIAVPANANLSNITISNTGLITFNDNSGNPIGSGVQLQITTFANEQALNPIGHAIFITTDESGDGTAADPGSTGYGTLLQNNLELSNVENATAFAEIMEAQRVYELCARILRIAEETGKELNK